MSTAWVCQIDAATRGGAARTIRVASHDDERLCHLDEQLWWPAIERLPTLSYDFFDGAFGGEIVTPTGQAELSLDAIPGLAPLMLHGARIRWWSGELGDAWDGFVLRFDGLIESQPAVRGGKVGIDFRVDDRWLDDPLLATYAGTTGAEGEAALKGQVKPLLLGAPGMVEGVLANSIDTMIQLNDGPIAGVDVAFEGAARFAAPIGDYASYAALMAAPIAEGQWATALAAGWVRHGAPGHGVLTYDVQGSNAGADGGGQVRRAGAMILRLAARAGKSAKVDAAGLAAIDAARPWNLSRALTEQTTMRQVAQELAQSINAVALVTWTGLLTMLPIPLPEDAAPVGTLASDGSSLPPVASVDQLGIAPPWWQLAIEAEVTHRVLGSDEVRFTATLIDRGRYDPAESYREGHIVDLADGSRWLYTSMTPTSGNAPAEGSAYWTMLTPALDAGGIRYTDGTPIEDLQPAEPGATDGAVLGDEETPGNITDTEGNPVSADDVVTSRGTAFNTSRIGPFTTAEFTGKVVSAEAQIAELLGTWTSGTAIVAAALAAKNAAEAAEANAQQARDDAQDASDAADAARVAAQTSATSAGGSATAAAGSASAALSSKNDAATAASAATSAKVAAESARDDADDAATAASTSASTAATRATEAGNSASAAAGSATDAATARGQAQTYAGQAATARDDAQGHAATASTQATNAANSATAAGGSATAAAGSASTASTKATEAGNSATAASSAKVAAESARDNAAGSASAASSSAATATAQAAAAQQSAILSASLSGSNMLKNGSFADWPGIAGEPPPNWSYAYAVGSGSIARELVSAAEPSNSPFKMQIISPANNTAYFRAQAVAVQPYGYLVLEADASLGSGSYFGNGIIAFFYDGSGNYLGRDQIDFYTHPTSNGYPTNADPVYGQYGKKTWSKLIRAPGQAVTAAVYIGSYDDVFGANSSNRIYQWYNVYRCGLRQATQAEIASGTTLPSLEATVLDQAAVLATHDTMLATRVIRTQAGPTSAEVAFHSLASGGDAASQITIRSDEVALGDMTKIALKVRGGDALFSGNINAGGGIFVGDRAIPVALQSFPMEVYDGQAVSYGASLGNIPDIVADFSGFATLPAGQSYVFRADAHTPSGFTARVKKLSSATLATATNTGATSPGTGPTFQMHKADARDAYNGRYTFVVTGSMYRRKDELIEPPETVYSGYVALRFWVRPAGASSWVDCGVKYVGASPGPTGNYTYTSGVQVDFGGTIGLDPTNTEFGVSFEGGWSGTNTLTGLNSVSYQYQVSGSETTATPGDTPLLPIRVMPKNQ